MNSLDYDNPWIFRGYEFTGESITEYEGFVYIIHNLKNNKKYIGKKNFWTLRKQPGKKRRVRKESNWKKYYGSNEILKNDVKLHGTKFFKREILRLCATKGEMTFHEIEEQFLRKVLKNDEYYNDNISGKFFKTIVKKYEGKI